MLQTDGNDMEILSGNGVVQYTFVVMVTYMFDVTATFDVLVN